MTAQIGDTFKFKGEDYSIVAISTPIGFNPQNYGITPELICTACWNGYWCEYEISDTGIFLKNLYINSKDELVFQKGKLIKTFQHNEMARKIREEIDSESSNKEKTSKDINIPLFVEKSFSLDMKDKAWWIE